ncbi:Gfo/Idh/MocA family protein [Gimesia aquarii]|uniref:Putative oxidoreductase YhhX n=1 Tax=Gimesia aquarii TaxID=2527964 RepID=A0A517WPZ4_9PLAN|nr:Gfo/Idh/MocA family oxidoreductase [Gimesia aquarii]QDU07308.1 putative oxidoreductase YhhX [Gimesia aquarii]
MEKIKVGQIGVGHPHAGGKMQALRKSAEYDVVGVVEPNAQLRNYAESTGIYKDLPFLTEEQLLNVKGLQAVAVETQVPDLLQTAEKCIAAGKHIHLDKPAGFSLPHFKRILDQAAQKHLLIQMGYMYRYNPGVVLLRDLLKKGWLGEPFEVHTVISKKMDKVSRAKLEPQPGGMMFELGCHVIDLVVQILGRPDQVTPFSQHASVIKDTLQDNMLAVFTYPKAIATVKSSCNEVNGFNRRHIVVCGSEGTFHLQPFGRPAASLTLENARGKYRKGQQSIEFPRYTRYIDDVADMARVIRREKDLDFSYQHDYFVQECVLKSAGLPVS